MKPHSRLNVLYIDAVGPFGGASRSLYEALSALTPDHVNPFFLGVRGTSRRYYSSISSNVITVSGMPRFDNTRYSFYKGIRWLLVIKELFFVPAAFFGVIKCFHRWRDHIDLIHVNEVTDIFPGLVAKFLFRVPLIVHVRSPQRSVVSSVRVRLFTYLLSKAADGIVAIDQCTRSTLSSSLDVDIIHNSFSASEVITPSRDLQSVLAGIPSSTLKVGYVGNLQVCKGILDIIECARILKSESADVVFIIAGGGHDASAKFYRHIPVLNRIVQDASELVYKRISDYDLYDYLRLLGPTDAINDVYSNLDIILFPSHLDAPGRPIFEAGFFGVPSIACISKPCDDAFVPNVTGIPVPCGDPTALASAIKYLMTNSEERLRIGENARMLCVSNFSVKPNALLLLRLYQDILSCWKSKPAS